DPAPAAERSRLRLLLDRDFQRKGLADLRITNRERVRGRHGEGSWLGHGYPWPGVGLLLLASTAYCAVFRTIYCFCNRIHSLFCLIAAAGLYRAIDWQA